MKAPNTREIVVETIHSITPAIVAEAIVVLFAVGVASLWCLRGAGRI